MVFLKKLLDIISPSNEESSKKKGDSFEIYVHNLFNEKYFSTEEWTSDIYNKRNGAYVESNKNPDLIIRYKPTGERFAVECKYRSDFTYSEISNIQCIQWSYPAQIKRYKEFQSSRNMPLFIVIGIGNNIIENESPKYMFCIPLNKAKYPEIFKSILPQFERDPCKKFFWKDGILK